MGLLIKKYKENPFSPTNSNDKLNNRYGRETGSNLNFPEGC